MRYLRFEVAKRLRLLPEVLGKKKGEIAELIGVSAKSWSNYTNLDPRRTIPWYVAGELKLVFDVTSDWLYFGDLASIRDDKLRDKIRLAELAGEKTE